MAQKIRIILNSGNEFVMECKKITARYSNASGELTSLQYEGCTKNIPIYIDVSKVTAVIQEEVADDKA